jgi:hypothetical protein
MSAPTIDLAAAKEYEFNNGFPTAKTIQDAYDAADLNRAMRTELTFGFVVRYAGSGACLTLRDEGPTMLGIGIASIAWVPLLAAAFSVPMLVSTVRAQASTVAVRVFVSGEADLPNARSACRRDST